MKLSTLSTKKEVLKKEILEALQGRIPLNILEQVASRLYIDVDDVYADNDIIEKKAV